MIKTVKVLILYELFSVVYVKHIIDNINRNGIFGKKKLFKLKKKGNNKKLSKAIDTLIEDVEANDWKNPTELKKTRSDADCVHSDGHYFFDINIHRTMILVLFEENKAEVVWVGSHTDYELTFKNNKNTINKWLRKNGWIL